MEAKKDGVITVGLFGTCGGSTWRNDFIEKCKELGIEYFNPQVDDWQDQYAAIEAEHLVNDEIVLFPVTNETYGTGSLAETGYSIFQALKSSEDRYVVIFVDSTIQPHLEEDKVAAKESKRARALVKAHLKKVKSPGVFVVNSLTEMLEVMTLLHDSMSKIKKARSLSSG